MTLDTEKLSKQLFEEGGFSVNMLGRAPKHGVMVSRSGSEHIVPGVASPQDIEDYVKRPETQAFLQSGHSARGHVGAWVEDLPGMSGPRGNRQTVFDLSQHFGPNQRESAMTQAAVHGQRATFDVDADWEDSAAKFPKPPIRGGMSDEDLHSRGLNDFPYRQTLPFSADEIGDVTAFSPRRNFYTAGRGARGDGVQGQLPFNSGQRRQLGMR